MMKVSKDSRTSRRSHGDIGLGVIALIETKYVGPLKVHRNDHIGVIFRQHDGIEHLVILSPPKVDHPGAIVSG